MNQDEYKQLKMDTEKYRQSRLDFEQGFKLETSKFNLKLCLLFAAIYTVDAVVVWVNIERGSYGAAAFIFMASNLLLAVMLLTQQK